MNKKILLVSSVLLTLSLVTIIFFNNVDNKENNIISNVEKNKQVINSNMITLMYETESGSGEYVETKDTTWPESGYIFNENISGCENGGELEYNSQNNTVNLLSNSSDRCYVYFDKYDGVWIDNVSITNVTGSSVTLDVSATSENGSITTYYYVLNDSEEYQESTSNVITINDLNKLTEYKISIYAVDSTNAKSNIYELSVSTTDVSIPVINSVSVSNITYSGFTLTVNATSDVEIERYYFYVNGNGENQAGTSTTNSFTFNTLEDGVTYDILVFAEAVNGYYSQKYNISTTTEEITIYFADYIIDLYSQDGSNNLYLMDESGTYGRYEIGDYSYRYVGADPNNYVCFGSTASTCPNDNLYRIIGVFLNQNRIYEVKLLKYDYANSNLLGTNGQYMANSTINSSSNPYYTGSLNSVSTYRWNWDESWRDSTLNTVNFNTNFLNNIGSSWRNMISDHNWYNSRIEDSYSGMAKDFYEQEIANQTFTTKVALMYVSDYGFAASPNNWSSNVGSYSDSSLINNWIFMGVTEWLLPYESGYYAYNIEARGGLRAINGNANHAVRPTFYLNSDVEYASGSGTISDPIRIKID